MEGARSCLGLGPALCERRTTSDATRVPQQFAYKKIAEELMQAIGGMSRYGTVFRVDLGLRPEGNKGRPVSVSRVSTDILASRPVVGRQAPRREACAERPALADA